ncbi:hypothetical protein M427DRAFT_109203 [Gonapodya prolifera JEL478]|uniref:Cytochrome b5 heme-binding domain-containing protein n=1 Tax=Gonapodya prolifera (strain JEL478) TaxID=1344416 RepID=A0A139AQQ8_GONPJ|nr:hypothetical protein M427DRAFT_109203 [Gonapodya prolifera JEL478]|eukprot:KXS18825.1 hypothetical protein M427DRAFT_109203 [Gonapodya prolifera JEL478]
MDPSAPDGSPLNSKSRVSFAPPPEPLPGSLHRRRPSTTEEERARLTREDDSEDSGTESGPSIAASGLRSLKIASVSSRLGNDGAPDKQNNESQDDDEEEEEEGETITLDPPPPTAPPKPKVTMNLAPPKTLMPPLSSFMMPPPGASTLQVLSAKPGSVKARKKVILAPGHGPLDWERLKNSGKDLRGGVTSLARYTLSDLRRHRSRDDMWMALEGKVYNITPYIDFHPGGVPELMRGAGRDGTRPFMDAHPWVNYEHILERSLIGMLVPGSGDGSDSD